MTISSPQLASNTRGVASAYAQGLQFHELNDLPLESGETLPQPVLAYKTWGRLNAQKSNAILIQHALTGSAHVATGVTEQCLHSEESPRNGEAIAEAGWWQALVGPGKPLDTDRFFLVAANHLGGCYGSTGPASVAPDGAPWGSRFPFLTLRDGVAAETSLADALGIESWFSVVGGSMGGARALEWAVSFPERVRSAIVIASGAVSTAEQIALAQAQLLAIRQDPQFRHGDYYPGPGPVAGLSLARRIAHISYRTDSELQDRFGNAAQSVEQPVSAKRMRATGRNRYQVESYLDHQGEKLVQRFDANSYCVLTEALLSHDITRGRGNLQAALARTQGVHVSVAGVRSDRLFRPEQLQLLADSLPQPTTVAWIDSPIGHDAFLTETEQLAKVLTAALA